MASYDPVYLALSDDPRTIVRKMVEYKSSRSQKEMASKRRRMLPMLLFLAGVAFAGIDLLIFRLLLGYSICLLTPVAIACWLAAVMILILLARSKFPSLSPRYDTALKIIHTLQDDIRPQSSFLGHIDLTGVEQDQKIAREGKDTLGRTNRLYRDQWLNLKLKLYDGNILRFSIIERYKTRLGYWKRGSISGKTKWKAPKFKGRLYELSVRVAASPEAFVISPPPQLAPGASAGPFLVQKVDATGAMLSVLVTTQEELTAHNILGLLQLTYDSLKRKAAS